MSGTISGGWEYVWAAYGVTAVALLIYTIALVARYRAEKRRAATQEE
ncbi:MAG TPA: heme exporter protein CcmD [Thermoanaerobaculia bacterium]